MRVERGCYVGAVLERNAARLGLKRPFDAYVDTATGCMRVDKTVVQGIVDRYVETMMPKAVEARRLRDARRASSAARAARAHKRRRLQVTGA